MSKDMKVPALAVGAVAVGCALGYMMGSKGKAKLAKDLEAEKDAHWNKEPKICDTILDHIGNTPLVRLNKIGKKGKEKSSCEILCKCEFFNAGGSVKDRIGRQMVRDAENSGLIKPGDTLIEPTSGNTGIGLSLAAAVMGYNMVIALPKKMSQEKVDVLNALGAIVKRTPTNAPCPPEKDGYPFSHIYKAKKIRDELNAKSSKPTAFILDQYSNPSNPKAHTHPVHGTAAEIYRQTDGKFDVLVATAGTGGTLAGMAYALKKNHGMDKLIVVGVDPHGSDLGVETTGPDGKSKIRNASTEYNVVVDEKGVGTNKSSPAEGFIGTEEEKKNFTGIKAYKVEGIGYDFIPDVLTGVKDVNPNSRIDLVDYWYKTSDKDSFIMSRRMIREEGLLCGGSCGSAVVAALQVVKDLKLGEGKRVVCILADSTRNYMTKFLSDKWMTEHKFASDVYKPVKELNDLKANSKQLTNLSCQDSWQQQAKLDYEVGQQRKQEKAYFKANPNSKAPVLED
jgi:cystathionine beta-synthase